MNDWERNLYKRNRRQKLSGLSLIEVVIIVTVLGVFAAIILSRLVFMTDDARSAASVGVRVALLGGINGAHQQWQAQSQPDKINLDGLELAMNNTGWPEGVSNKANGHVTPEKCLEVWNAVLQNPPIAGVICNHQCVYTVSAVENTISNRMECVYTHKNSPVNASIYYDVATGFVY